MKKLNDFINRTDNTVLKSEDALKEYIKAREDLNKQMSDLDAVIENIRPQQVASSRR